MADMDWSDLRYALAIGRGGSVAAAARQLGVNATTVQRRLDALETRLGARLFDRTRGAYQPTDAGAVVLDQARRMADQADEIERRVLGRDRELTGPLRVTTAFVVMEHLLPPAAGGLRARLPGHRGRGGGERLSRRPVAAQRRHRADLGPARGRRGAAAVGQRRRAPGRAASSA